MGELEVLEHLPGFADDEKYAIGAAEALIAVDWPAGLDATELAFCRHHAEGKLPARAYMHAQRDAGEPMNKAQAAVKAGYLLRRPEVNAYIKKLRQEMEKHCVATGATLMTFLTAVIYTPIDEVDGQSPLCHKKVITRKTDKDGNVTEIIHYEMPNKLKAVERLAKMKGLDAPTKVEHSHSGGIMVMPFVASVDDWTASVADQQKKLMEDAINV